MKGIVLKIITIMAIGFASCMPSRAAELTLKEKSAAIKEIANTAAEICPMPSNSSTNNSTFGKTNIDAKLSGLSTKLASLGISASAGMLRENTSGILQKDRAASMNDAITCRKEIAEKLIDRLVQ